MVKLRFGVVIEKDEDGYYVAYVPELPGCHTQARTLDELLERIKEAVELYLEVEEPIDVKRELIGVQFIEVGVSESKTASS
ncbi:MAG: type II toxin-antitoxin system HicB family antitoxin [archaeon YNP-LCB-024-027]|nr:type II toxin-antitoxin system HicB family antitoxin [Candidatus Culexarchaeum yellowstonense]